MKILNLICICLILNPIWIFGNTLILKDGRKIENVKTSLREDHVLVEDETGKVEKIDLTLVEKILVSEIKKPEAKEEKKNIRILKNSIFLGIYRAGVPKSRKKRTLIADITSWTLLRA